MKNRKLNVLDLFAGAGGLSLGFHLTGKFSICGSIDNWKPACDTFAFNHPETSPDAIVCSDIKQDQKTKKFLEYCDLWTQNGDVDVIVGGPPCQGMSLAGKRISDDPRNQLFKTFVKTVGILRPKVMVMENVPGLLSIDDGKLNEAIMKSFQDIGYNRISNHPPSILKAETYGVPQIRRRLFYVAFREDFNYRDFEWPPRQTHFEWKLSSKQTAVNRDLFGDESSNLYKTVSVSDAISDLPHLKAGEGEEEMEYPIVEKNSLSDFQLYVRDWSMCPDGKRIPTLYNHVAPKNTSDLIEMIKETKPGESVDPNYADSKKWHPDRPGFTVKALGAGGGSTNRRAFHFHPKSPRGSTVRENARIQSFPDWYRFMGPKTHQMTQVGNAVPPLLAYKIAIEIYKSINGK